MREQEEAAVCGFRVEGLGWRVEIFYARAGEASACGFRVEGGCFSCASRRRPRGVGLG